MKLLCSMVKKIDVSLGAQFEDEYLRRYAWSRLLNKKHLYLTKCHICFKIHKQLFLFRISKFVRKHSIKVLFA